MVKADEVPHQGIIVPSGTKDYMFDNVSIPRAFNQVIFQFFNTSTAESPASVKLTALDLATKEILGEFLVNRYESERHTFSYEFRIPAKLLQEGKVLLIRIRPDIP
jgi:hypothetical protein